MALALLFLWDYLGEYSRADQHQELLGRVQFLMRQGSSASVYIPRAGLNTYMFLYDHDGVQNKLSVLSSGQRSIVAQKSMHRYSEGDSYRIYMSSSTLKAINKLPDLVFSTSLSHFILQNRVLRSGGDGKKKIC